MKKLIMCLPLVLMLGCSGRNSQDNPQAQAAAVTAAQSWLALIDNQKYGESWAEAAPIFEAAVGKDQWQQTMEGERKPFGKNLSRTLLSSSYRTSLPGAPDGQYVVIQFTSSFENKKTAVETVTPMLDTEGKWRVSGYYMK